MGTIQWALFGIGLDKLLFSNALFMDRRSFIHRTSAIALGSIVLGPGILSSCSKPDLFKGISFDGKVIIIGAGAAGLYAACLLEESGVDFQVLEADARIGGRIGKNDSFADFPLDLGAQWLHGKRSLAGKLVRSSGAKVTKDRSDIKYWYKNAIVSELPDNLVDLFEQSGHPDVSFEQLISDLGLSDDYANIVEGIAGDSGADASNISAYWNAVEMEGWSSGASDFKFEKTYYDLLYENIAKPFESKIQLNTVVSTISYPGDSISIMDTDGTTYSADKLIITVPITVLKDGDITFDPPLSSEKTSSFNKIGMDAGMKVFLKFSEKFYEDFLIGGSVCAAYANEKTGKSGNDHVLLAFIMGEQAEALSALSDDNAIVSAILEELDLMYDGRANATFLDALVQDWTANPFVKGAYSYSSIGIGNAREVAAGPVENKLFFAGEALNYNGHHQTVHGAMETGRRVIEEIVAGLD